MITMGAFVASGGMDTLRYHATAVDIGDVLTDEDDEQTFSVDFRFRFISEQARTFFIKQYFRRRLVGGGPGGVQDMCAGLEGLVSLTSDGPPLKHHGTASFAGEVKPALSGRHGSNRGDFHERDKLRHREAELVSEHERRNVREGQGQTRVEAVYMPDTKWIARTEALSTILRPSIEAVEPVLKGACCSADNNVENRDQTVGPSYLSDSSDHTSYDMSDEEFCFAGPPTKRSSSLAETEDSIELTRNYWARNRSADRSASQDKHGEALSVRRQRGKQA